MKDYIFSETIINKGYNTIFLCGVKYSRNDEDKRNILKAHLESLDEKNKVIILEENFTFGKSRGNYLSYDDIFMKNLKDVETLTAIFSDKVIIIHESISTGAEFGMFATNELLKEKLCLLIPDEYSVEENKITAFLNLAFLNEDNNIKTIVFYPSVEQWKVSQFKSDFRTKFQNNNIGAHLSKQLSDYLTEDKDESISVNFKKSRFGKYHSDKKTISYFIEKDGKLKVGISTEIIKAHIISFFNITDFKAELRKCKKLSEHITYVERLYKNTLLCTISEKEGEAFKNIIVECKDSELEFRKIISYVIYLLQAMKMINLIVDDHDPNIRQIGITKDFGKIYKPYNSLLKEKINTIIGV